MKRGFYTLLLLLFALRVAGHAQIEWRVYTAPNKSFTVELPWEPTYVRSNLNDMPASIRRNRQLFKGSMSVESYDLRMYSKDEPTTRTHLGVHNLSESLSEQEFDAGADSLMSRVGGKDQRLLKNEPVTVNGLRGREYVYERGKASGRALIVNAKNRVYFLHYHTESEKGISRGPVERVFNSFRPRP